MIKKLEYQEEVKDSGFEDCVIIERKAATPEEMQEKINELVDAVNELQKNRFIVDIEQTNPVSKQIDPYAEQHKWIGKLCWFSQLESCHQHLAILKRITESGLYVTDDGELHYAYCKPVKPDDDIIYNGD